jgi:hypothetical protein
MGNISESLLQTIKMSEDAVMSSFFQDIFYQKFIQSWKAFIVPSFDKNSSLRWKVAILFPVVNTDMLFP